MRYLVIAGLVCAGCFSTDDFESRGQYDPTIPSTCVVSSDCPRVNGAVQVCVSGNCAGAPDLERTLSGTIFDDQILPRNGGSWELDDVSLLGSSSLQQLTIEADTVVVRGRVEIDGDTATQYRIVARQALWITQDAIFSGLGTNARPKLELISQNKSYIDCGVGGLDGSNECSPCPTVNQGSGVCICLFSESGNECNDQQLLVDPGCEPFCTGG